MPHTPGPWTAVGPIGGFYYAKREPMPLSVCGSTPCVDTYAKAEKQAAELNAEERLRDAAPALLAACEAARDFVAGSKDVDPALATAFAAVVVGQLDAAIQLARGA